MPVPQWFHKGANHTAPLSEAPEASTPLSCMRVQSVADSNFDEAANGHQQRDYLKQLTYCYGMHAMDIQDIGKPKGTLPPAGLQDTSHLYAQLKVQDTGSLE